MKSKLEELVRYYKLMHDSIELDKRPEVRRAFCATNRDALRGFYGRAVEQGKHICTRYNVAW